MAGADSLAAQVLHLRPRQPLLPQNLGLRPAALQGLWQEEGAGGSPELGGGRGCSPPPPPPREVSPFAGAPTWAHACPQRHHCSHGTCVGHAPLIQHPTQQPRQTQQETQGPDSTATEAEE